MPNIAVGFYSEFPESQIFCQSAEEVLLLRRGIIFPPHSNKISSVLNHRPRKDVCRSVGATYIYCCSDDRQESANK